MCNMSGGAAQVVLKFRLMRTHLYMHETHFGTQPSTPDTRIAPLQGTLQRDILQASNQTCQSHTKAQNKFTHPMKNLNILVLLVVESVVGNCILVRVSLVCCGQ